MPIITLTSDIGQKDYLAGAIKGRLWQKNSQWQIADLSHQVSPFNYNEAAYFVRSGYPHFPVGSWHLVLVNLFDKAQPSCLLASYRGHYFACPDNGLLPMILDGQPDELVRVPMLETQVPHLMSWIDAIGNAIVSQRADTSLQQLGTPVLQWVEKNSLRPRSGDDWIEGNIIYIDRFENVVTNISRHDFETVRKGRPFTIHFKSDDRIQKLAEHYGMVAEGDKLAYFNTGGLLEIAVNKGNAAGLFGLQAVGDEAVNEQLMKARMFYRTVKILFQQVDGPLPT